MKINLENNKDNIEQNEKFLISCNQSYKEVESNKEIFKKMK